MSYISLDGPWTLTAVAGPVPADITGVAVDATVPGCAHTDLLRAGLISEPFDGDNEAAQQWIGSTTWRYERSFEWQSDGATRHDLVAQGLDTLATVTVNGTVVALTRNQHRSYRFSIAHLLVEGTNTIAVQFEAPVDAAERIAAEHGGALPHVNHHPYNSLRKVASNFGWDWGIDVATSGIWKPIGIDSWSDERIVSVRPLVDVVGTTGILRAHVAIERTSAVAPASSVTVTVSRDGSTIAERTTRLTVEGIVELDVPDAALWWPVGHGDQPLYDVTVVTGASEWHGRIGFRTITLDTSTDVDGNQFLLSVNDKPIWIRGANWIPDHAFVTEITADRLSRRVNDALEANMNLLRVWGGGMYESEDFYRICDERGVLVWQDFLLACAAYAEEEWLATEIIAEAREAVTRLSAHASLVIWNGNNENIIAFAEWGWRAELHGRTWGNGYYRNILPSIVSELDPTRPYSPGSPYSYDDYLDPNDDKNGTVHIWDVWNQKDYTAYREWKPRFVSEFGFQGPPAWTTITDVVHDEPLEPYGKEMLVHQKAYEGNRNLARGYAGHLPEPQSIDDWHFTTQLNQAHAIRFGIEYFRSLTPYNTGTIVWQLNDDWPVVSWAAIDFAERRKPLWYALRLAYQPRLITVQPAEEGSDAALQVVLVNDTDDVWSGVLHLERQDFGGSVLATETVTLALAPRSVLRQNISAAVAETDSPREQILVASVDDESVRAIWNYVESVEQQLDLDPIEATAETTEVGARVTVTARSYVRDLTVLADRAHPSASVDDSLVSLLAGESAVFELRGDAPIDPETAISPLVLRHVNQLLARATAAAQASEATAR